jgi:hypothetical protein
MNILFLITVIPKIKIKKLKKGGDLKEDIDDHPIEGAEI